MRKGLYTKLKGGTSQDMYIAIVVYCITWRGGGGKWVNHCNHFSFVHHSEQVGG